MVEIPNPKIGDPNVHTYLMDELSDSGSTGWYRVSFSGGYIAYEVLAGRFEEALEFGNKALTGDKEIDGKSRKQALEGTILIGLHRPDDQSFIHSRRFTGSLAVRVRPGSIDSYYQDSSSFDG